MTNTIAMISCAIFLAEGGDRARVPYGILSVPVRDKAEARQVCERTVRNNLRRWERAGRPGCFFDFLGDRYCPAASDPIGNRNWKRNVRAILRHQTCDCPTASHPSEVKPPNGAGERVVSIAKRAGSASPKAKP